MARKPDEEVDQLDLFGPRGRTWFAVVRGGSTVWVIADDADEASVRAKAELRGMGFLPPWRSSRSPRELAADARVRPTRPALNPARVGARSPCDVRAAPPGHVAEEDEDLDQS